MARAVHILSRAQALALAALCSCLWVYATPLAAQTVTENSAQSQDGSVTLTLPQAKSLAVQLIRQNRPKAAREIVLGILRGDPNDIAALLILSQTEAKLGRPAKARFAARRAFRVADTPQEKYASAALVADSFAQQNRLSETQIWLRRAEPFARDEKQRQSLARSYAKVRNANPLRVQLSFNIKPTDNLNNAPTATFIIIGGLPFEIGGTGRALSGTEISYGADLTYSKPTASGDRWSLGLEFDGRDYVLSSAAKDQAPDARSSDFAFHDLRAKGSYTWLGQDGQRTTLGVLAGSNWYAGDKLTDYVGADIGYRWVHSPRTAMDTKLSYTQRDRRDADSKSSHLVQLSFGWTHVLENKGRLRLSAAYSDTASDSAFVAHDSVSLSASYALPEPILNARANINLSLAQRDYDTSLGLYGPDPRADKQINASLSLFFQDLSVYGFAPIVTLNASETFSNIDIYDVRQLGLSIGFASVF